MFQADKLEDEFNPQYIIKAAGDDYQRIDENKAPKASLIIPVDFPCPYCRRSARCGNDSYYRYETLGTGTNIRLL